MSLLPRCSRPSRPASCAAALAGATLIAACASAPSPADREGEEELELAALSWTARPDLFTPPGPLRVPDRLEGVRCTFTNDKGTWTVTAPGRVKVRRSAQPLAIDCFREGFAPFHEERQCLSQDERNYRHQKVQGPVALLMLPLAIVAMPIAPHVAAQAGAQAVMGAASLAGAAGTKGDVCSYGVITPNMSPR